MAEYSSAKDFFSEEAISWDCITNDTFRALHKNRNEREVVCAAIDRLGFRGLKYLAAGQHAIAFQTTRNQILRVSVESEDEILEARYEHPAILQPIYSEIIEINDQYDTRYKIEILPKVVTEGVTRDDIAIVVNALAQSGLCMFDPKNDGNIGLIFIDGKRIPVVIDSGLLQKTAYMDLCTNGDHLKPWLDENGEWLQKKYDPRIGTKPENVITGAEIDKRNEKLGYTANGVVSEHLVGGTLKHGLYADEDEMAYENALSRVGEDAKYTDILDQERRKMVLSRKQRGSDLERN